MSRLTPSRECSTVVSPESLFTLVSFPCLLSCPLLVSVSPPQRLRRRRPPTTTAPFSPGSWMGSLTVMTTGSGRVSEVCWGQFFFSPLFYHVSIADATFRALSFKNKTVILQSNTITPHSHLPACSANPLTPGLPRSTRGGPFSRCDFMHWFMGNAGWLCEQMWYLLPCQLRWTRTHVDPRLMLCFFLTIQVCALFAAMAERLNQSSHLLHSLNSVCCGVFIHALHPGNRR